MEAVELQVIGSKAPSEIGGTRAIIAKLRCAARSFTVRCNDRDDKALKLSLQNLLDSLFIAIMWGFSRCWSVRAD